MSLRPLNLPDSTVQIRNFEEEKKIKSQAEALVRVWFDIKTNPDPVAREILDFMAKLKVDARVIEEAYKLLAIELNNKNISPTEIQQNTTP